MSLARTLLHESQHLPNSVANYWAWWLHNDMLLGAYGLQHICIQNHVTSRNAGNEQDEFTRAIVLLNVQGFQEKIEACGA